MRLEPMPEAEEQRRVWLSPDELDSFIDVARDHSTEHYITMGLMGRCGLRRAEALNVTPLHLTRTDVQPMIRLEAEDTKAGYFRSTPVPESLYNALKMYIEYADHLNGMDDETPFVDTTPRTVARWVTKHAATSKANSDRDEGGWDYLSPHDLRRGWANRLIEDGVAPPLIMNFGGWQSWPDFRDAYLNGYSSKRVGDELDKVAWM